MSELHLHRAALQKKGEEILDSGQRDLYPCVDLEGMACPSISRFTKGKKTGYIKFQCDRFKLPGGDIRLTGKCRKRVGDLERKRAKRPLLK